ncbi:unnamed protein product, partial [Linum tenue]
LLGCSEVYRRTNRVLLRSLRPIIPSSCLIASATSFESEFAYTIHLFSGLHGKVVSSYLSRMSRLSQFPCCVFFSLTWWRRLNSVRWIHDTGI